MLLVLQMMKRLTARMRNWQRLPLLSGCLAEAKDLLVPLGPPATATHQLRSYSPALSPFPSSRRLEKHLPICSMTKQGQALVQQMVSSLM